MLTDEQRAQIERAVEEVAAAGWGTVAIVIARGQVLRLQRMVDLRFERLDGTAAWEANRDAAD